MAGRDFFDWLMYIFAALLFFAGMLGIGNGIVSWINAAMTHASYVMGTNAFIGGIIYLILGFGLVKVKDMV